MALDPLDELRFAFQVLGDAKRTWVCPPSIAAELRAAVNAAGCAGLITVVPSQFVPDGTMYVIDEQGFDADLRQTLQHMRNAFG